MRREGIPAAGRMRMQVVVNADDVGLHPGVLRAVERCAEHGVVTSASLLANGPCLKDARGLRGLGLAAHLNVLRGAPLSPPREIPSLVGSDGLFLKRYTTLFSRYVRNLLNPTEIEREWARQIERLRELGFELTHLDSEKHVHCWPALMPVACRLASRFHLRWVRRVAAPTTLRLSAGGFRGALLHHWSGTHVPVGGVAWPDAVWGVCESGTGFQLDRFARWWQRNPQNHVVEVVCHPGLPTSRDGDVPARFGAVRAARHWASEAEALLRQPWREWLTRHGAELTHYGRIAADRVETARSDSHPEGAA